MAARTVTPTWRERVVFYTLITACVAGAVYGTWQMVDERHDQVTAAERAKYHVAEDRLTSRAGHALHLIHLAADAVAEEKQTLDASSGKTLDEDARTALATRIRLDTFQVAVAHEELRQTEAAVTAQRPSPSYWASEYATAAAQLDKRVFPSAGHLAVLPERAATTSKAVTDAVAAWQKDQERIAAEKAAKEAAEKTAAEEAARAAAERSTTRSTGSGGDGSGGSAAAPAGPSVYVEHVGAYGWQAEIDSCIGAVDITSHYGIHTIARHNYCGGTAFPKYAGALVQLSGVEGGLYRVIGIVANLNGHTDTTADLPRGYDLLYQTCVNGYSNMSFTALEKIG